MRCGENWGEESRQNKNAGLLFQQRKVFVVPPFFSLAAANFFRRAVFGKVRIEEAEQPSGNWASKNINSENARNKCLLAQPAAAALGAP
jgi:hypothetical protein